MNEKLRAKRNRNPHGAARIAMFKWGTEYAAQRGGSMDFWDSLTASRKLMCREVLRFVLSAPKEQP